MIINITNIKKTIRELVTGKSEISIKKMLTYLLLPLIYILAINGHNDTLITIIIFVGGLLGLRSFDKNKYSNGKK